MPPAAPETSLAGGPEAEMRERTTPINRLKEGVIVPPFVGPYLNTKLRFLWNSVSSCLNNIFQCRFEKHEMERNVTLYCH